MKYSLITLILLISVSATAGPWNKLVNELTSKRTLTELKNAKAKFYSRQDRTPLTRSLDFGYEHTSWEFNFIHGNYSTDFILHLITKNDSIVFGKLERLHWKGRVSESIKFAIDEFHIRKLVNQHNRFYSTFYDTDKFINELTTNYYFSLGCGDTESHRPKEAEQMLKWAKSHSIKKLSKWLRSPNYELQAYAIEGLTRIREDGKILPKNLDEIIEHLLGRNCLIINCSGCLMGLKTPLDQLLFEYRKK